MLHTNTETSLKWCTRKEKNSHRPLWTNPITSEKHRFHSSGKNMMTVFL